MYMTDINILTVPYCPSKSTCWVTSDFDLFFGLGSLHIPECYLAHHLDAVFLLPTSFIVHVNERMHDWQLLFWLWFLWMTKKSSAQWVYVHTKGHALIVSYYRKCIFTNCIVRWNWPNTVQVSLTLFRQQVCRTLWKVGCFTTDITNLLSYRPPCYHLWPLDLCYKYVFVILFMFF